MKTYVVLLISALCMPTVMLDASAAPAKQISLASDQEEASKTVEINISFMLPDLGIPIPAGGYFRSKIYGPERFLPLTAL